MRIQKRWVLLSLLFITNIYADSEHASSAQEKIPSLILDYATKNKCTPQGSFVLGLVADEKPEDSAVLWCNDDGNKNHLLIYLKDEKNPLALCPRVIQSVNPPAVLSIRHKTLRETAGANEKIALSEFYIQKTGKVGPKNIFASPPGIVNAREGSEEMWVCHDGSWFEHDAE